MSRGVSRDFFEPLLSGTLSFFAFLENIQRGVKVCPSIHPHLTDKKTAAAVAAAAVAMMWGKEKGAQQQGNNAQKKKKKKGKWVPQPDLGVYTTQPFTLLQNLCLACL
jgi:hypothetical protein